VENIRPSPGRLVVNDDCDRTARPIGFALSFVILTMFLIVALDRRPARLAVAVGIGLAVAFHMIFVIALDVSLPVGPWGF
jgi:hypothetical protein